MDRLQECQHGVTKGLPCCQCRRDKSMGYKTKDWIDNSENERIQKRVLMREDQELKYQDEISILEREYDRIKIVRHPSIQTLQLISCQC